MAENLVFEDLTKDDVEVRVQQCGISNKGTKWAKLLIYKNARIDMNLLDKAVGAANWQRKHYECKGTLFCEIGIKIDNEWVWKGDAGVPSNAEAAKGEASDSFKRAGFNWGIGRELYTAPNISIFGNCLNLEINKNGKGYKCTNTFEVTHLVIENKKIVELKISTNGNEIYSYPKKTSKPQQATEEDKEKLEKKKADFDKYLTSISVDRKWVERTFEMKQSIESLNLTQFEEMTKTVKGFVEMQKKKLKK